MPQHLIMLRLSATEQATKASKEMIHVIKNPGPQNPFMIGESQLMAIDKLEKLFKTIQYETTQTAVVPRNVPNISSMRVPVTVPPPRVKSEFTPPRVMIPRKPMITQEEPIEDIRQRDIVEHNNQHQLKQR